MIILLVLSVVCIFSSWRYQRGATYNGWDVLAVISCFMLSIALLAVPFSRMIRRADLHALEARRVTWQAARGDSTISRLELAAIQGDVAGANAQLARNQFYRGTLFRIWIPAEVMTTEPIR